MAIFYLLHNIIPVGSKESSITDGQRNCKLFLLGVFLYVMIYIYMKNIQLAGTIHEEWYESLKVGFYVLIIADISVMSFIYKDYYGRSILHEVDETINNKLKNEQNHEYDETTHKYKRKLVDGIFLKKDTEKVISKEIKKIDVICDANSKDSKHDLNKIIARSIKDEPDENVKCDTPIEYIDPDNQIKESTVNDKNIEENNNILCD